jgi:hypothetical protein
MVSPGYERVTVRKRAMAAREGVALGPVRDVQVGGIAGEVAEGLLGCRGWPCE